MGKRKGNVKNAPGLTYVIGWMAGPFTNLEKSVIKKLLCRDMEGRRNQQFYLSCLEIAKKKYERGS